MTTPDEALRLCRRAVEAIRDIDAECRLTAEAGWLAAAEDRLLTVQAWHRVSERFLLPCDKMVYEIAKAQMERGAIAARRDLEALGVGDE